ncbi:glycosyltransferase family 2 protein [Bacteroides thetaiotaomicron]|uniref:glycosyltransferase family 2 protein n=1 Tax=Bacteroides thetaiotaomicron TaxID=818 RepID=UPI0021657335|nr:glycosyltransferase family A protein [Bacteroides thetaiotaomicron]MCS3198442.1 glycosyltransferase family 2 protein [Bacteroides thetaiotaomicron]
MTKWYKPYLEVFEKPVDKVPAETFDKIRQQLKNCQSEPPLVSVVLIAHNEEQHLLSCLWSLSENHCNFPIEILVANNNSTDKTEEVLKALNVPYYNETQKGPGYARQCGLDHARGKYHVCIDSDTLYPPNYIETHVRELMKPGVAAAFSLWSFMPDKQHSRLGLWCYECLRDLHLRLQAIKRPELCIRGMAFSFNTELGRRFGFRTDIIRGEDGSLALAMKPYGKLIFITSPKARVMTSNGTLNTDGSLLNSFRVRLVKAIKNIGGMFSGKSEYKDEDSNLIK